MFSQSTGFGGGRERGEEREREIKKARDKKNNDNPIVLAILCGFVDIRRAYIPFNTNATRN